MKKLLAAFLAVTMCVTALLGLFSLNVAGQLSEIYLSDLTYLDTSSAGWSTIKINQSVNNGGLRLNNAGFPMSFDKGIAAHADSIVEYDLSTLGAVRFTSYIGVCADGGSGYSSVDFEVKVDGVSLYKSETLYVDSAAVLVSVAIPEGAKTLTLLTTGAGDGNHSDHTAWLDAKLYTVGENDTMASNVLFESTQYTLGAGSGMQLKTVALPEGALTGEVIYSVQDPSIASVTPDGYVFGKGLGATTVNAYYPVLDMTATATLRVCADGNYTLDEQTWEVREDSGKPVTRDYPAANMAILPITYGNTNQDIGSSLLLPAPDGDFEITVKVSGGLAYDYQLVGLVAYTGHSSMVTVARRYHTYFGGNVFCASTYVDSYNDQSVADPASKQDAYLKMTKSGTSFVGYYSFDGKEWVKIAEITSEIGNSDELKIGITAMTSSGGNVPVLLTDFTLDGQYIPFAEKSSDLTMKVAAEKTVQTVSALLGSGDYSDLVYEIENTTLATVDENGLVTGIKPGITKLTATKGAESQSFDLQVFSDKVNSFDDDTWQIVNPKGESPAFSGNTAVINIPTGDFGDGKTISNLVLTAPTTDDFDIRVKVSGGLGADFESIGLVAYVDVKNGVAMERRSHSYFGGNVFCITDYESGGNEPNTPDTDKDADAWVRLVKEGNFFTGYYSYDGETWTAVADAQENVTVGSSDSLKVGIIARSGSYGSDKSGTYTDFTYNGTVIPFCTADKACIAYPSESYRVAVDSDASVLPETVYCYMESGVFTDVAVEWNTEQVDFTRPGVYEIEGEALGITVKVLLVVGNDLDGDGQVSIGDVTALLNYLAGNEAAIAQIVAAPDINDDGQVTIGDVTALLNYLAG
ncbi:MAG: NPCBM/NEW2 domain-containing protein [Clostridia bacterium]|nr:NPCBM/NEW2 domain-containing protein [Clostridia bacterium]